MTDKPSDRKDQPAAEAKRPHATLDLKATELKGSADSKAAGAAGTSAAQGSTQGSTQGPAQSASKATSPTGGAARNADAPVAVVRGPSALTRIVTHALAGVAGGAVVLFGGDRIAQMSGIPYPTARLQAVTADLEQRIAALETATKTTVTGKLDAAEERLAKLETLATDVGTLHDAHASLADETKRLAASIASTADTSATDSRLARLEDQLKTIASAASADSGSGEGIAGLAAVTTRIADLDARLSAELAKLREGAARDMDQRLAGVGEAAQTDIARLSQQIETLKAGVAQSEKSGLAAMEETGRVASSLGDVRSAIEQQGKTFAKADDVAVAVAPVTAAVAKIETSLQGLIENETERQGQTARIVTALELGNLKRAIESGRGFAAELAAVEAAAESRLDLKALEPFKTTGVPSLAALKDEARAALAAALDTAAVAPDASAWDRLLASAKSVVRVRKIDAAEGDTSVEARVARIDKALAENRLADVLAEAGHLPPEAAARIADWRSKVAARHSVDAAIAAVENELKTALAPAAPTPPAGGGN